MKAQIASGVLAGVVGGLVAALLEILFASSSSLQTAALSLVVVLGLGLPFGILTGLGLIALPLVLPKGARPKALAEALLTREAPATTGWIIGVGLVALAALPLYYRLVLFFHTAFHHVGLTVLAECLTLLVFFAGVALFARGAGLLTGVVLAHTPRILSWARRPAVALGIVAAIWLACLAPPVLSGPDAKGVFGFMGLVRKDGLGALPLVTVAAMIAAASLTLVPLLSRSGRPLVVAALLAVPISIAGLLLANGVLDYQPIVGDAVTQTGGHAAELLSFGRKVGDRDRDGFSRWLGGRDCDDRNAEINPGARDVPGNSVDEDCSGSDLELDALRRLVGKGESRRPAAPSKELTKPTLPDDVSLLVISIDTWRWDAAGFMGYQRDITPNVDKLATQGTIYERAYGLGSYTGQAIPPLLTGKYASELKRNDRHEMRVSKDEKFAAELICNDKVRCAAIVSHQIFAPGFGWSQGFHEWNVIAQGEPRDETSSDLQFNSPLVAQQALRWLKKPENTAGRFWLWVHFMDPHKEYVKHPGVQQFGRDRRALYDQELLFTDQYVGKVLDTFKTLDAAQRTIVIITSDHGEAFGEHGMNCHGAELWEEIIRVPMAVIGPGIANKRIQRPTSQIDFFPTVLDIFGVPIPAGTHGQSLLPDWVAGQELSERPIIADQPRQVLYQGRRVFIHGGWKLHHLMDTGTYRLYPLSEDYERGESMVKTAPDDFARTKAAYELFQATQLRPVAATKTE